MIALNGVIVGWLIWAIPGLGSVNGEAISSILLGIPGASTGAATTFDERPMTQQGRAGLALIAAAIASFVSGTIWVVLMAFTIF